MTKQTVKLHDLLFEVYVAQSEVDAAVKNIAERINADMRNEPAPPVFLCVLNGAFMFAADLLKHIEFDCEVCFLKLSSYEGTASSGKIRELVGLNLELEGRTVILLEDIIDSGVTLEYLVSSIAARNPERIKICTMLFKPDAYTKNLPLDYVGISIENEFVVGRGLDYNQLGRNYKDIYKLIR
ncbi:MAG: hypoxanthine phosphoribosyltransferase [Prevotellaceae bacterium]|jgi:hypoxanthine phosphoribosyltransferase|nr:hypoxanthine phosphoribosyltransferase [Prevotellaceae bacterium]